MVFTEPEDPSPLIADLYRWWYRQRRLPANRLFIESFAVHEPYWTLRTGSVPFWMKFNMRPSLEAVQRYLDRVAEDPYDEILLALFQHGVEAVGLPSADEWRAVLDRARTAGTFAGTDIEEFPLDFAQFARYDEALKRVPARYPLPAPLTLAQFGKWMDEHGDRYDVRWIEQIRAR